MKSLLLLLTLSIYSLEINSIEFYKVFSNNDEKQIDKNIQLLNNTKNSKQKVYLGALLMKKSDFQKDVKIKVATFKEGAALLEKEIALDSTNVEYRFIRLIIQEKAPKILKYNLNLEEDKNFIIQNYKNSSVSLKEEILKYSKISNILNL